MNTVTIRRAEPSEASKLTEIAHAAKRHWGYPEEYIRTWEDDLTFTGKYIEEWTVYAAVCEGVVVGVYALGGSRKAPELEHLWVLPGHMGRGIGKLLFLHALRVAAEGGAESLRIVSDPNAEGFYLKMGARRIGDVPSTPGDRVLPLLTFELP